MTQQTKRLLNLIFIGEDGKLSFTALFAFFSFVVMVTLYIKGLIQGYDVAASWLDWSITIIEVAVIGRASQKVLFRGADAIASIRKPKAEDHLPDVRKTMPKKAITGNQSNERQIKKAPEKQPAPKTAKSGVSSEIKMWGNFSLSEFDSKDGAKMPTSAKKNILILMQQLEVIREACGNRPITITSGYRSPAHNAAQGGAKDSQHMKGNAADFKVKGLRPTEVRNIVKKLMDDNKIISGGLKSYKSWVHYDIRGGYVTW